MRHCWHRTESWTSSASASRLNELELSKAQGIARLDLQVALKGWYNPKKDSLGPSPLVPPSSMCINLMTPTACFNTHRSPVRHGRRCEQLSPKKSTGTFGFDDSSNAVSAQECHPEPAPYKLPQALVP